MHSQLWIVGSTAAALLNLAEFGTYFLFLGRIASRNDARDGSQMTGAAKGVVRRDGLPVLVARAVGREDNVHVTRWVVAFVFRTSIVRGSILPFCRQRQRLQLAEISIHLEPMKLDEVEKGNGPCCRKQEDQQ